MAHHLIIGNGISGTTTARHIRKRNSTDSITIISEETDHFFSRTALMYIYMGHMEYRHTKPYEDSFWKKSRIKLVRDRVTELDFKNKNAILRDGAPISYDTLTLALGSRPNKFGWPGQDLPGVQGLYSYQDLEMLEANTDPYGKKQRVKRAVIVGGGLIGIELAEMLLSRNIPVTFLVREKRFWNGVLPNQESELIMRHMREHHVDLRTETELKEVVAGADGRACAVITNKGERIDCQVVGLTAGVHPNIGWLKDSELETNRGIKVNEFLETNIEGVHAVGDCAEFHTPPGHGRRNLEQVWYTGRMHGETLAKTITGERTAYRPGHWFNSAKFMDIEYQTYGWVMSKPREGEEHFYWEHPDGKRAIHFNFDSTTKQFIGVNVFGMRMRHEVVDAWLKGEKDMGHVLSRLKDAHFDPEFYDSLEGAIVQAYNKKYGTSHTAKKRSLANIFSRK